MKLYNVGIIVGFHGLKGEMKIKSTTDFEDERFAIGSKLILKQGKQQQEVVVRSRRIHKNTNLIAFEGFETLSDVEPLKGAELKINEEQLIALPENEYFNFELIGLEVFDYQGNILGKIKKILDVNANDILVVDGQKQEIMIPFVSSIVDQVDIDNKKVTLFEIEGLW